MKREAGNLYLYSSGVSHLKVPGPLDHGGGRVYPEG